MSYNKKNQQGLGNFQGAERLDQASQQQAEHLQHQHHQQEGQRNKQQNYAPGWQRSAAADADLDDSNLADIQAQAQGKFQRQQQQHGQINRRNEQSDAFNQQ